MLGGFHEANVTDKHRDLVNSHIGAINNAIGANHAAYNVDKAWSQVVAGTNIFLHLSAGEDQVSVLFFIPLPHTQSAPSLNLVEKGHTQARRPQN